LTSTVGTAYVVLVLSFWSDSGDHPAWPYLLAAQLVSQLVAVSLVIAAFASRRSSWLRSSIATIITVALGLVVPVVVLPVVVR
jgi:hypothetical protein